VVRLWYEPDASSASHEAELRAIGARRLRPVYPVFGGHLTTQQSTPGTGADPTTNARTATNWAMIRGMSSAVTSQTAAPMPRAYRTVLAVGGPIMHTWSRMRVAGLDQLPQSGPTLLIANHDSYWDPIAIAVAARPRRQIRALAKSTLWKVGFIGRLMDSMGHIPIDRKAANEAAVDVAIEALRSGECIGVFPEGPARSAPRCAPAAVPGGSISPCLR
jgi:1-acyl-sn-glycerol-3-phosphate acyltransferase